jgi:hypothetical protein
MSPRLPAELIACASLRGGEYAWPVEHIPAVLEAARSANLINIGGQLQFRLPGATCECCWVKVDTCEVVPATLPWSQRVQASADEALRQLEALKTRFDFLTEGQRNFTAHFETAQAAGIDPINHMRFVWYVESEGEVEQSAFGG